MTARRGCLWAAYWTVVAGIAAVAATLAAIPFTGTTASVAALTASAAVCWAGLALAPCHRKDGQ